MPRTKKSKIRTSKSRKLKKKYIQKGSSNIKIYVINLKTREEKWNNIKNLFSKYPIQLERISVEKNNNPVLGCGLSHLQIIKMAKDKNLPYVFVMEDDSKPTEYFDRYFLKIIDWLQNNLTKWDIFLGGNSYYYFNEKDPNTIQPICKLDDILKLYKTKSQAAHCICYNSSIYDKMLEWDKESAIDLWPNIKGFNIISCTPFICVQEKGYSNIQGYNADYTNYFKESEKFIQSIPNEILCEQSGGNKMEGYVINLDERKDRWEQIQEDFKHTSIKLERFSAIRDSNGHVGVGKSFQALIKMAKEKNMESILIMEDDCKPLKYFEKRWQIVKNWLDNNKDKWNIFNGGPITPMEQKLVDTIDDKNKIFTSNGASALHFVIFSNRSYDKILEWTFEKDHLLDWYINRENNKYVFIDPPLALQHSGKSDTNSKIKNFTNINNDQATYSLNKIKELENLYQDGGKKILINYANKGFVNSRKKLKESALTIGGLDEVIEYDDKDIDSDFRKKHSKHFENTRGAGLWLWKPYLILKTLKDMKDNDILVYCDAGATFTDSIIPYIEKMKGDIMLFFAPYSDWSSNEYTKMDIFKKLDCVNNKEVTHGTQIEGGFILLRKSNNSIEFIEKWLELCSDYHLISDEPSNEPNLPEFKENRHDQSILSALGKLYKDKYNIDIENKPFINHHRSHNGGRRTRRKTRKIIKGGNKSNYTAIIVEPRKHKALEYVLKNFLENLNNNWNIIIYHGNLNKEYVKSIINKFDNKYKKRITLRTLNKDNINIDEYNNLLTSKSFYEEIPTDTFLIFQTDTLINPRNKNNLSKFLKYDYVGAPWSFNREAGEVGNGGLSLRKKTKMLEILNNTNNNLKSFENIYLSLNASRTVNINKPNNIEAQLFSSETIWNPQSFGIHAPWKYNNLDVIQKDFPEITKLVELQSIEN